MLRLSRRQHDFALCAQMRRQGDEFAQQVVAMEQEDECEHGGHDEADDQTGCRAHRMGEQARRRVHHAHLRACRLVDAGETVESAHRLGGSLQWTAQFVQRHLDPLHGPRCAIHPFPRRCRQCREDGTDDCDGEKDREECADRAWYPPALEHVDRGSEHESDQDRDEHRHDHGLGEYADANRSQRDERAEEPVGGRRR